MQGQGIDLSGLRDIHLPELPPFFPLPMIFWIVLFLLAASVFLGWKIWLYSHRITAKKYANREVESLTKRFEGNDYKIAVEICLLLRRIALTKFKREDVSSLSGKQWRRFLENTVKKPVFSGEAGDVMENIMYIPQDSFHCRSIADLIVAAKEWISENT